MWNTVLEGQARFLDLYVDLILTGSAAVAAAMQNTERFQRAHIRLLTEFWAEQGRLAALQTSQGFATWRAFLAEAQETQQMSASEEQGEVERAAEALKSATEEAPSSAMQSEVERAAEALIMARNEALRVAQYAVDAVVRESAWTGPERRTALATAYSGVERRRAA